MMRLPELKFNLPEWSATDFKVIKESRNKLERLTRDASKRSPAFEEACRKILFFVLSEDGRRLSSCVKYPVDARAVAYLLARSEKFRDHVEIDSELFEIIQKPRLRISRLTLTFLIEAYLSFFDELGGEVELGAFITHQLQELNQEKSSSDLAALAVNRQVVFSSKGPFNLVEYAQKQSQDLDVVVKTFGLQAYKEGRFMQLCRYRYFLETLRQMPVGAEHEVLDEVCKPRVHLAPGEGENLLGHEIVAILIDRSQKEQVISDAWQKVILTIAGDPRVPRSSPRYQQWWALLGEARVNLVRGWLSRFDLGLFLKVLEDYGKSSGNADLQRMFPSRKRFLEGLIEQGLVSQSRLFVNPRAESYLRNNYDKDELPEYARVRDTYRSMIYLQVGHLHVIEGSHSFKLWVFPKLPDASDVLNYGESDFIPGDVSTGLEGLYWDEFGQSAPRPASIVHVPSKFAWQHNAIVYLKKFDVRLDVEKLFSEKDYVQYKRYHGVA